MGEDGYNYLCIFELCIDKPCEPLKLRLHCGHCTWLVAGAIDPGMVDGKTYVGVAVVVLAAYCWRLYCLSACNWSFIWAWCSAVAASGLLASVYLSGCPSRTHLVPFWRKLFWYRFFPSFTVNGALLVLWCCCFFGWFCVRYRGID